MKENIFLSVVAEEKKENSVGFSDIFKKKKKDKEYNNRRKLQTSHTSRVNELHSLKLNW